MRNALIKFLGGYTKDEVLTEAVRDLFNTIGSDDIIEIQGDSWTIGEKVLKPAEVKHLKSQAHIFVNSRLWRELKKDIKYRANKIMFEKAKSEQDLTAGKLWLYTIDVIDQRLKDMTAD